MGIGSADDGASAYAKGAGSMMANSTPTQVHLETFGCQMNEYDSELVRSLMKEDGFVFTDERERADVILMNTCAIRENAHNKV